jgi:hypothetical protein
MIVEDIRSVMIVEDRANKRPWIAQDYQTGAQLLRLQDRDHLVQMCWRLGWRIRIQGAEPVEKRAAS